ncbi:MAG: hypothetical protein AAF939_21290 [Planctomycetota bacterium]
MERLEKNEIRQILRGKPGLILVQAITSPIESDLATKLGIDPKSTVQELVYNASENGVTRDQLWMRSNDL